MLERRRVLNKNDECRVSEYRVNHNCVEDMFFIISTWMELVGGVTYISRTRRVGFIQLAVKVRVRRNQRVRQRSEGEKAEKKFTRH